MRSILKNKRGFTQELLAVLVVGIIATLFFAGWYYGSNLINTQLTSGAMDKVIRVTTNSMGDNGKLTQTTSNFTINISQATLATYSQVNSGYNLLGFLAAMIFLAMILGTLVTCYFAPGHPLLIGLYILVTIGFTIGAIYISQEYSQLLNVDGIGAVLSSWTMITFFMTKLQYMIALTGFIGASISLVRYYSGGNQ
jgi:hypothetical protein